MHIEIVGDGKCFRTAIRKQITHHFVVGDVDAIGTFINKDGDWRVRSGIGNVLDHFFDDEWIPHHKPHDLGGLGACFATQNGAQVESAKSIRSVQPRSLCTTRSKSGKEFAALVALKNSTISGWPTADLSEATTASNGLELVKLKRSTSTFAIVTLSSTTTLLDIGPSFASNGAEDHAAAVTFAGRSGRG
jgi:hypothetical protein